VPGIANKSARPDRSTPASPRSWMRADTLSALDKVLREAGHDPAPLFADHGIDIDILDHPEGVVPIARLAPLLEHVAASLGMPDVGLRLAQQQRRAETSDPVDLAIFNAPTLKDAFLYGERHVSYYCTAVFMEVRQPSPTGPICLYYQFGADQVRSDQITEYGCLRAAFNIIDLAGSRPLEVWFRHAPRAAPAVYAENFAGEVRFGMPYDAVFIDLDDWLRPIERRDPKLHLMGQALAAKRKAETAPFSAHLRGEIERLLPVRKCSYDSICKWSGIPPRTLRRYLADESTTFAQLKDEVRRDNVRHALSTSDLDLTELAQYAGYYDPSSVTRNLPRWFGPEGGKKGRAGERPN
jgi:AraC-like DNA-binding protein